MHAMPPPQTNYFHNHTCTQARCKRQFLVAGCPPMPHLGSLTFDGSPWIHASRHLCTMALLACVPAKHRHSQPNLYQNNACAHAQCNSKAQPICHYVHAVAMRLTIHPAVMSTFSLWPLFVCRLYGRSRPVLQC